jgi:hypothetical protein
LWGAIEKPTRRGKYLIPEVVPRPVEVQSEPPAATEVRERGEAKEMGVPKLIVPGALEMRQSEGEK